MTDTAHDTPEHALQRVSSEMGLSMIDIATVLYVLKRTNGPQNLIECLESAIAQMSVAGAALEVTRVGLVMAIDQRNEAVGELTQAKIKIEQANMHGETAREDLAQLEYNLETWNRDDPRIAALIDAVWVAAQDDLIQKSRSRKGA